MADDAEVWSVNAAGEVRNVDGETASPEQRRELMERLAKKSDEGRASTVEVRCLAALRRREREGAPSQDH